MSKINNIIESIDNSFAAMLFSAIDRVDDTNAKRAIKTAKEDSIRSRVAVNFAYPAFLQRYLIKIVSNGLIY